jgi:E3 ubiquitin-protein ligase RAD18
MILENGLADCPVCGKRMKVDAIDSHLNKCLVESSPPISKLVSGSNSVQSGTSAMQKPSKKPDRLPQLNYSLFKDTTLRKKLQELGISAQGSRPLLERRHTEWVTLWNANCDASRPRKKVDLLHELDVWERTQGARVSSSHSGISSASQILHKDFDGASWAAKHDLSFQNLIASARKNLAGTSQPIQMSNTGESNEHFPEALATPIMPLPMAITSSTLKDDPTPDLSNQTIKNENN